MSFITFQCYACGKALKVPGDKAGRKAKCNQCGTVLTIPAQSSVPETPAAPEAPAPNPAPGFPAQTPFPQQMQPAAPPQEQAYEPAFADLVPQPAPGGYGAPPGGYPAPGPGGYPAPAPGGYSQYPQEEEYAPEPSGPAGPPKWSFVRLGLLIVFICALVMSGGYALEVIGYLLITIPVVQALSGTIAVSSSGHTPFTLLGLGAILGLLATLGSIAGYVLCIMGPNKKNSFGLAIAATAVAGVEALLIMIFRLPGLFGTLFTTFGSGSTGSFFFTWLMLLFIQLLFGAEIILFLLVVRAYCLGLKKKQSARGSTLPLSMAATYTGIRLLTFICWYIGFSAMQNISLSRVMGWITILLLWAGIVVFIVFLIVYPLYLWRIRNVIPAK
jgi:hypothetical protein